MIVSNVDDRSESSSKLSDGRGCSSGLLHPSQSKMTLIAPPGGIVPLVNIAVADLMGPVGQCRRGSALSSSAHSHHTNSTLSDISNHTVGHQDAVMDIYHPNFWNVESCTKSYATMKRQEKTVPKEKGSTSSRYSSMAPDISSFYRILGTPHSKDDSASNELLNDSFHEKGASYKSSSDFSSTEGSCTTIASSLHHLIQSLNRLPLDNNDDSSVLSNISDMTEISKVFTGNDDVTCQGFHRSNSDELGLSSARWHAPTYQTEVIEGLRTMQTTKKTPSAPRRHSFNGSYPVVGHEVAQNRVNELLACSADEISGSLDSPDRNCGDNATTKANAPPTTSPATENAIADLTVMRSNDCRSRRRIVSFGSVQIRHYERILSDNPASRKGPSIGIGWKYTEHEPIKVSKFEGLRKKQRCRRASELVLSRKQRERLIYQLGYTERDMAIMVREINKCRYKRQQTVNNLSAQVQKMEEAVETARRKMLGVLTLQSIGASANPSSQPMKACSQQPRLPQRGSIEI